jgi:hypothetical protein
VSNVAKATTLRISAKCNDLFAASLLDKVGHCFGELDGYVPRGLGIGGGDYVNLNIDLATGKILDWVPPTTDILEQLFK